MPHHGSLRSAYYTWMKICLLVFVPTWFVNEHFIYWLQSWRWPTLPALDRDIGTRQVILLVGDPQVVGYQEEPVFPFGAMLRWDSDRYLKKTFSQAYSYCNPDVVLFLGDLMDEGSKATGWEYKDTYNRFMSIFEPSKYSKTIYIPGDNDIGGGEMGDYQTKRKLMRFQSYFGNITDFIKFGFIDYIKLDLLSHHLTQKQIDAAEHFKTFKTSNVPVIVNHFSLLMNPKHFVYPVTKRLGPKVVFSAHWHRSEIYTCDDCLEDNDYSWAVKFHKFESSEFINLDLGAPHYLCELAVPTCSYRMGRRDMGYGVAIIDSDKTMQYAVLWLPRRYTMLLGYLLTFTICIILFIISNCSRNRWRR